MTTTPLRRPEPSYRTVLVPLDGSAFAAGALPTAHALAARFGATVHVVTVTVALPDAGLVHPLDEAAAALGTSVVDPRVHVAVDDDIAAAVRRTATQLDACLICLSAHGHGRVTSAVIGSTARDIIERGGQPVVVAGPFVVHPDSDARTTTPPLEVDHLVACVDGTPESERGIPDAIAWADALGMKLTMLTVAEPCPPPLRIGAPWRRSHGPNEDADEYVRRLADQWSPESPELDTVVVYDPISPAEGLKTYLSANPTGLIAVTKHLRAPFPHLLYGSDAAAIVHRSPVPTLVIPLAVADGADALERAR